MADASDRDEGAVAEDGATVPTAAAAACAADAGAHGWSAGATG